MQQIIPIDRLKSAQRVLFIFDLSLKNFLSVQSYLFEFSKSYPFIKIDLWINTNCDCFFGHKQSFREKLFIEFLQECSFINKFYLNTCCTKNFKNIYAQASDFNYSIIVILSEQEHCSNIKLAKKISKKCFLVSTTSKIKWYNFVQCHVYKILDAKIELDCAFCPSSYNNIFQQLFSEQFVGNHKSVLFIPRRWVIYAKLRFMKWGIDKKGQRFGKVFFINAFDDNERCSCSLKKILELVTDLKRHDEWGDINFVLHVPPSKLRSVRKFFIKHSVNNMYLFSADNNFYQVPSILSLCDGVFSVDGICSELSVLLQVNNLNCTDQSVKL